MTSSLRHKIHYGNTLCEFWKEDSLAVSPKVFLVDVLLVSMVFPTGKFLRLFPGKEMAKINDLKTPDDVLTRLHFSGKK